MFSMKNSDALLEMIRNKQQMTAGQKMSLIVWLSVPGILAQITSVLMFYIDAAMVGHLGAKESASIGLVESSTWLFGSVTNAAAMGFAVQVAHFIGAGDFVKARDVFRHAIVCTLIFGLLIGVAGVIISGSLPYWLGGSEEIAGDATIYFRVFMFIMPFFQLSSLSGAMLKSSGDMRVPSIMSILMCVLDVVFNYIFIFIFHLGVLGAAIGTAISIIVGGLGQAYFAVFRNKLLSLRLDRHRFVWNGDYVRNALKISSPMAAQSMLMGGAQIVSTIIVAPLGMFAIAANSFAVTAESLCYMPGYGIGEAATTLVGQSIGAGQRALTKSFARMTIMLGMGVMAFMGIVMYVFAPEMIGFLSPVEDIRSLGITVLRIEAFAEPFFAASIVGYSICVGAGDTLRPALMNLVSMWLVRLTLAAMLAPRYGLPGVWFAMAVELTFRGTIFLIRIYRGKWMKKF
ncbi:MAG: MATE family efflux transporter [Prevotella sp.]|uniref:MATE family efflux transporter n=1 Tax=Prevotella sp. TaxID=59823 RepID=UPI002A2F6F0B|nr:MATE family efflux transporter [Prevotella sp.]MDD7317681.1 MATE family efflux transporter [Prevotellaceae bacterium]MDY4020472.1 MATE family efflux transporter [Prevotella sp.]